MLERRVAVQDEAQDRDERQQQREQREERVVSDKRGETARPVVGELLDHRDRDREPAMPLLMAVERADGTQQVHVSLVTRAQAASGDRGGGSYLRAGRPRALAQHYPRAPGGAERDAAAT